MMMLHLLYSEKSIITLRERRSSHSSSYSSTNGQLTNQLRACDSQPSQGCCGRSNMGKHLPTFFARGLGQVEYQLYILHLDVHHELPLEHIPSTRVEMRPPLWPKQGMGGGHAARTRTFQGPKRGQTALRNCFPQVCTWAQKNQ